MLNLRLIQVLLFALLTGNVVADPLCAPPVDAPHHDSDRVGASLEQPTLCGKRLSPDIGSQLSVPSLVSATGEVLASTSSNGGSVIRLPGGPGSSSLVTAGLVCLGAVGGLRSLRKAHFGSLPEWYSTSGPQQIGHATPIDFDFPLLEIRRFETVDQLATLRFAPLLDFDSSPQRERLTRISARAPPNV